MATRNLNKFNTITSDQELSIIDNIDDPTHYHAKNWLAELIHKPLKLIRHAVRKTITNLKSCPIHVKIEPNGMHKHEFDVRISFCVNKPREDVFLFCRNLSNLPFFMTQLVTIKERSDTQSYWKLRLPDTPRTIGLEMEIINEIENQLIIWHSMNNSIVKLSGRVDFLEKSTSQRTEVQMTFNYRQVTTGFGKCLTGPDSTFKASLIEGIRKLIKVMEIHGIPKKGLRLWI